MITAVNRLQPVRPLLLTEPGAVVRFGAALAYAALCIVIYERLSYRWSYFGFVWDDPSSIEIAGAIFLSSLPALFLPRAPRNLFQFAAWVLYFAVFAPAILIPILQHLQSSNQLWSLMGVITLGSSAFMLASRWKIKKPPEISSLRFSKRAIIGGLLAIYFAGYGYVLVAYGAELSFTAFADVYEQRASFAESSAGVTNYIVPMLANVINPLLMAIGLKRRLPALVALGIIGAVLCYGTFALKSHILTPMFVIGTYLLFDRSSHCRVFSIPLALIIVSLICLPFVATYDPVGGIIGLILTMLFVRTLLIPGVIIGFYSSYFSNHPQTFYSHSSVGRLFATYPYGDLSVGQIVGYYVVPSTDGNLWELNGSFVATDGIAAMGIPGIVIAFVLSVIALRIMARAAVKAEPAIAYPAAVPFLITLANTSLFSSMLTGGGILLTMFIYLWGNARETADDRLVNMPAATRTAP